MRSAKPELERRDLDANREAGRSPERDRKRHVLAEDGLVDLEARLAIDCLISGDRLKAHARSGSMSGTSIETVVD